MKKLFVETIMYNEFNHRQLYREVEITKIKRILQDDENIEIRLDDKKTYNYNTFIETFKDLLPQTKRNVDHKITTRVSFEVLQRFKSALKHDGERKGQDVVHEYIMNYIKDVESRAI